MRHLPAIILLSWLISGCSTHSADRYAISVDTQVELKQIATKENKIMVDSFTASKPGQRSITCRAVGPIKTPDGEAFEDFVQKALVNQLRMAELYATNSPVLVGGHLDNINFNSTNGLWTLVLTVKDTRGRSFTVQEHYSYSTSFYGETACNQTAQAFMPAVQNLIRSVVNHPTFQEMITDNG